MRHPQYVGFSLIKLGFLLQWSTLPTLIMFPILVTMYVRLARREEREHWQRLVRLTPVTPRTRPPSFPAWREWSWVNKRKHGTSNGIVKKAEASYERCDGQPGWANKATQGLAMLKTPAAWRISGGNPP